MISILIELQAPNFNHGIGGRRLPSDVSLTINACRSFVLEMDYSSGIKQLTVIVPERHLDVLAFSCGHTLCPLLCRHDIVNRTYFQNNTLLAKLTYRWQGKNIGDSMEWMPLLASTATNTDRTVWLQMERRPLPSCLAQRLTAELCVIRTAFGTLSHHLLLSAVPVSIANGNTEFHVFPYPRSVKLVL